jgi:glycosyltransferase involved in cell wall biosynthesis
LPSLFSGAIPILKKPKIIIDARMIRHSGIGRYLRCLLPHLALDQDLEFALLGNPDLIAPLALSGIGTTVPIHCGIYSVREQWELPVKIPSCDLFWSPHYNVPVLPIRARHRLVTIHDVFHLAYFHTLSAAQKIYARIVLGAAVKRSGRIITDSEFSRSEILRYLKADPEIIRVIPCGIDPGFNGGYTRRPIGEKYVLYVGNVKPHKNLRNALAAFDLIRPRHPDAKFYIVGRREGFITGDRMVTEMLEGGLRDSVVFTGGIDDGELKNYYANASLFVLPSLYEGFGLTLLEAMSFGLPIISSDRASLKEVGGRAVEYFNPEDIPQIAAAMENGLNGGLVADLAKYRERLDYFRWETSAASHLAIIKEMLL